MMGESFTIIIINIKMSTRGYVVVVRFGTSSTKRLSVWIFFELVGRNGESGWNKFDTTLD